MCVFCLSISPPHPHSAMIAPRVKIRQPVLGPIILTTMPHAQQTFNWSPLLESHLRVIVCTLFTRTDKDELLHAVGKVPQEAAQSRIQLGPSECHFLLCFGKTGPKGTSHPHSSPQKSCRHVHQACQHPREVGNLADAVKLHLSKGQRLSPHKVTRSHLHSAGEWEEYFQTLSLDTAFPKSE